MKFHLSHYILHAVGLGALIPIIMLTSTTDTIQSHGGPLTSKHELAFGGMRSHWTGGGMNYKFDGTFPTNPTNWKFQINQAASHLKSNTFATRLSASNTGHNLVSIGGWPAILSTANVFPGGDACQRSGKYLGTVACTYPVTSTGAVDYDIFSNLLNNMQGVAIVFDEADVYQGTGTNRTVRPGWTAAKVKWYATHEFGHALGFFDHLGSGNLMHGTVPQNNLSISLSTDDKWNLNRLYITLRTPLVA